MAETFGVAAGVIQIVGFGIGTASKLYQFSKSVGTYPQRVERLADHVEANSRVLKQLAELLEDDAKSGHSLSKSFQKDIQVAAKTCRRVFEEIQAVLDKERNTKIDRLKYTLFDESQIDGFRTELSQCQVTLNLMLLIHWRKDIAQTRQDIMDLLRGKLDAAKTSTVPDIAATVEDFVGKFTRSSEMGLSVGLDEKPLSAWSERLDPDKGTSRGVDGAASPKDRPTTFHRHLFTSFVARPHLSTNPAHLAASSTKALSLEGSTLTGGTSTIGSHQSLHCMWSARVEKDKTLSFDRMPISSDQAYEFAIANAVHLLKTLAKLDRHIESAIQAHTKKLQHDLVAVKPYQNRWSLARRGVSSLHIATKQSCPAEDGSARINDSGLRRYQPCLQRPNRRQSDDSLHLDLDEAALGHGRSTTLNPSLSHDTDLASISYSQPPLGEPRAAQPALRSDHLGDSSRVAMYDRSTTKHANRTSRKPQTLSARTYSPEVPRSSLSQRSRYQFAADEQPHPEASGKDEHARFRRSEPQELPSKQKEKEPYQVAGVDEAQGGQVDRKNERGQARPRLAEREHGRRRRRSSRQNNLNAPWSASENDADADYSAALKRASDARTATTEQQVEFALNRAEDTITARESRQGKDGSKKANRDRIAPKAILRRPRKPHPDDEKSDRKRSASPGLKNIRIATSTTLQEMPSQPHVQLEADPSTSFLSSSSNNASAEDPSGFMKSFRVSMEEPCWQVLPVALKKTHINEDPSNYSLCIVYGEEERCLGRNERPLILFKQLANEGKKPMFMLRKRAKPQEGLSSNRSEASPIDGATSPSHERSSLDRVERGDHRTSEERYAIKASDIAKKRARASRNYPKANLAHAHQALPPVSSARNNKSIEGASRSRDGGVPDLWREPSLPYGRAAAASGSGSRKLPRQSREPYASYAPDPGPLDESIIEYGSPPRPHWPTLVRAELPQREAAVESPRSPATFSRPPRLSLPVENSLSSGDEDNIAAARRISKRSSLRTGAHDEQTQLDVIQKSVIGNSSSARMSDSVDGAPSPSRKYDLLDVGSEPDPQYVVKWKSGMQRETSRRSSSTTSSQTPHGRVAGSGSSNHGDASDKAYGKGRGTAQDLVMRMSASPARLRDGTHLSPRADERTVLDLDEMSGPTGVGASTVSGDNQDRNVDLGALADELIASLTARWGQTVALASPTSDGTENHERPRDKLQRDPRSMTLAGGVL